MKRLAAVPCIIIALFCFGAGNATAAADYPEIRFLSSDDSLFVQQQAELEDFYRLSKTRGGVEYPPVSIFSYRKRAAEDLFSLNARLGLPYDTLATLNNAANAGEFNVRSRVLIATQPGIFVNDPPRTALEEMMLSSRFSEGKPSRNLVILRDGRKHCVLFFPGETFTSIERAYFLGILFRFPIVRGKITSLYGMRKDPFSGAPQFHTGLDIGAAEGTAVYSARDGSVAETGTSSLFGNYVILSHPGGFQTVYGHLATINVRINQMLAAGAAIGTVGRSGRATGPHLHFEVRKKGSSRDPFPLLAMRKG